MRKSIITKSIKETQDFGRELAKEITAGDIICFFGDLGAGKTTLIQAIAKGLGIKKRLISPTFVLIRSYGRVHHIDLYRLDDPSELGLAELWQNPKNILLIEWPEKIAGSLPRQRREIHLKILSENEREITYETVH